MIYHTVSYRVGEASVPLPLVVANGVQIENPAGLRFERKFATANEATAFITANEGVFVLPGTTTGTLEEAAPEGA